MDGFVNVLKPSGPTASDIVVKLKKIYSQKKIGHLGTLDPGASGVLPIALGKATRLFNLLTFKTKKYRVYFTFGKTTDTLDSYGTLIEKRPYSFSNENLQKVLESFIGTIKQIPPKYSAISINGMRAYSLARQGIDIELPQREVDIYAIDIIKQISEDTWCFDISCSGGTYMRSLARDIAEKLGTVGYMSCLIRLSSGVFDISTARTIEEIANNPKENVLDIKYPLRSFEDLVIPKSYYKQLYNGVKLSGFTDLSNNMSNIINYNIYCNDSYFGVGTISEGKLSLDYRLID